MIYLENISPALELMVSQKSSAWTVELEASTECPLCSCMCELLVWPPVVSWEL